MGKPDLAQNRFYENKERFADIFNGVLFQGRQVIRPDELDEAENELVQLLEDNTMKRVVCDKVQKWKGTYIALLVLENQTYVDYRMVLRAIKSEVFAYEKQREQLYEKLKRKKVPLDGHEFLSKMKRGQKLKPIITLVMYMGIDKPWDGARDLYGLLRLPQNLKSFVSNYKLNLYDFHDDKDFSRFQKENRMLLEALSCMGDVDKFEQMVEENPDLYQHVSKDCAVAIKEIAKLNINIEDTEDKEDFNMKNAFEQNWDRGHEAGMKEGKIAGKLEGKLEGISESIRQNLTSLIKNLNLSEAQAMDVLEIPQEERNRYLPL